MLEKRDGAREVCGDIWEDVLPVSCDGEGLYSTDVRVQQMECIIVIGNIFPCIFGEGDLQG
jgi:hypothetical protein